VPLYPGGLGTWGDIEAPEREVGILNVSLHKLKGKYYARVYRNGRTHSSGYHDTPQAAEEAAREIRLRLDGSRPSVRANSPK
jgi:hypothetical protein